MSLCNIPSFNPLLFLFVIPAPIPALPIPDLSFSLGFTLPSCPLD